MTMRRLLQTVLVTFVLVAGGCARNSIEEKPPTNKTANDATKYNVNSNATAVITPTVNSNANALTGRDSNKSSTDKEKPSTTRQGDAAGRPLANTNSSVPGQYGSVNQPAGSLNSGGRDQEPPLIDNTNKAKETPENVAVSTSIWDTLILALEVAGGVLLLSFIVMGLLHLRNKSWNKLETHLGKLAAQVAASCEGQKELAERLSSIGSAQNDTNSRLQDVHTEVRSLARMLRESASDRGDRRRLSAVQGYSQIDQPAQKEEPEFPVSAVDYLGKMTRFANVVRPDFQNGILVNDPDGHGELMLIRDSRVPDDTQPLFVVPRTTQFLTKQDFYTYYEKYYDCVRPSAGDVWIIDPAVVEKVSGGWQLREKGVLEIR